jgi:hypothetical protein
MLHHVNKPGVRKNPCIDVLYSGTPYSPAEQTKVAPTTESGKCSSHHTGRSL